MQVMGLFDFLDGIPDDYEPKTRMSAEETQATFDYLKNHPLFMTESPESVENHPELQALQMEMYNDTPFNIATSLLEKGNELVRTKGDISYFQKEALKIYSDGINQECDDKILMAKLFSNRALVQYKRKNYKAAITDCKWSIEHDPTFVKPYFRCAQCLYQIMHFSDALKMCDLAMRMSKDKDIVELRQKIGEQLDKLAKQKEQESKIKEVSKVCRLKGIRLAPATVSLPAEFLPKRIHLMEEDQTRLAVPILVSYPEFGQRDFIQSASEVSVLKHQLEPLFEEGLPWDSNQNYTIDSIQVYIQLDDTYHARLNGNSTILEIMKESKVTIRDFIELIVVSGQSEYYKQKFRHEYRVVNEQ